MNTVTAAVRAQVIAREGECCAACGRYCTLDVHSVHHRRTKGSGGSKLPDTNAVQNLLLLCGDGVRYCHGYVTDHRTFGETLGFRVPQGHDPLLRPVLTARNGWVFLTAEGGYLPTIDPHPEETRALELVSAALLDLDRA